MNLCRLSDHSQSAAGLHREEIGVVRNHANWGAGPGGRRAPNRRSAADRPEQRGGRPDNGARAALSALTTARLPARPDVSCRQRSSNGAPRNVCQHPENELRVVRGKRGGPRGRDGLRSQ